MNDARQCPYCDQPILPEAEFCTKCRSAVPGATRGSENLQGLPASQEVQEDNISVEQTIQEVKDGGMATGVVENAPGGQQFFGGTHYHASSPAAPAYNTPLPLPPSDVLPDPGHLPPGSRLTFPATPPSPDGGRTCWDVAGALFYNHRGPLAVTQAIAGLGGVGKTQLAVELCYRYGALHPRGALDQRRRHSAANSVEAEIAACGLAMSLPVGRTSSPSRWRRR